LNDPVRAIDKKQKAWIDSSVETFSQKMDKIYLDEEASTSQMKPICKDSNLLHPPEKVTILYFWFLIF